MAPRLYAKATPRLVEALEAAPRANLVPDEAPNTERLTAWAEYGYDVWLEEQGRQEKIRAYQAIAADEDRQADVSDRFEAAVKAGRF